MGPGLHCSQLWLLLPYALDSCIFLPCWCLQHLQIPFPMMSHSSEGNSSSSKFSPTLLRASQRHLEFSKYFFFVFNQLNLGPTSPSRIRSWSLWPSRVAQSLPLALSSWITLDEIRGFVVPMKARSLTCYNILQTPGLY